MISPPMASYDSVSPAPAPIAVPFAPEEEEAFWSLFESNNAPGNEYIIKYEQLSGSSSRADGSGACDDMSSSTSSSRSMGVGGPRTIESFLAAYATPAPSTVGAPPTPHITPTLPSSATFTAGPFTPAPTGVFYTTSPEASKEHEPAEPQRRELKRQRNTEASARFRLRKKQRENELESHASMSSSPHRANLG